MKHPASKRRSNFEYLISTVHLIGTLAYLSILSKGRSYCFCVHLKLPFNSFTNVRDDLPCHHLRKKQQMDFCADSRWGSKIKIVTDPTKRNSNSTGFLTGRKEQFFLSLTCVTSLHSLNYPCSN